MCCHRAARSRRSDPTTPTAFTTSRPWGATSALAGDIALFGHSLGGHIVSKYAAIFPEQAEAIAVVEGLGPPHRAHESNEAAEMQVPQFMIMNRLRHQERRTRPIKNQADAVTRLLRNNPRLDVGQAQELIPHLLKETDNGLVWAFDSVPVSSHSRQRREILAQHSGTCLRCQRQLVLRVLGAEMGDANFDGRFAENEMQERIDLFQDCQHHWFERRDIWCTTTSLTGWLICAQFYRESSAPIDEHNRGEHQMTDIIASELDFDEPWLKI